MQAAALLLLAGALPLACEMSELFSSFAHFRLECVTSANAAQAELKADTGRAASPHLPASSRH